MRHAEISYRRQNALTAPDSVYQSLPFPFFLLPLSPPLPSSIPSLFLALSFFQRLASAIGFVLLAFCPLVLGVFVGPLLIPYLPRRFLHPREFNDSFCLIYRYTPSAPLGY